MNSASEGYPWSMWFRAQTAMRLRLLLVLIFFFYSSLRGENIVNSFLQRLLLCSRGVVAAVRRMTFMISLKACSNQVQDLPQTNQPKDADKGSTIYNVLQS
jgi:hypothetical protein